MLSPLPAEAHTPATSPGAHLEPRGGFHWVVSPLQWPESTSRDSRPRVRHLALVLSPQRQRWVAGTGRTAWLIAMCQPARPASTCPREPPRGLRKGAPLSPFTGTARGSRHPTESSGLALSDGGCVAQPGKCLQPGRGDFFAAAGIALSCELLGLPQAQPAPIRPQIQASS